MYAHCLPVFTGQDGTAILNEMYENIKRDLQHYTDCTNEQFKEFAAKNEELKQQTTVPEEEQNK